MIKKYCIVLFSLLLLIMTMPLKAFAMEGITAVIPFAVENSSGTIEIKAIDDAPVPAVTEFTNVTNGEFEIVFTEPGDYYYLICQRIGTDPGISYDQKIYTVLVSVYVDENDELYAAITVSVDENEHKPERIVFTNMIKTPDTDSTPIPDYPSGLPYYPSGDEPFDPGGSPIGGEEEELPEDISEQLPDSTPGETPDTSPEAVSDGVIDNDKEPELPQTGQLWWPVPIMLGTGMLLFGIGIMFRRKEQKEHE